jgi:hypothetical protein
MRPHFYQGGTLWNREVPERKAAGIVVPRSSSAESTFV